MRKFPWGPLLNALQLAAFPPYVEPQRPNKNLQAEFDPTTCSKLWMSCANEPDPLKTYVARQKVRAARKLERDAEFYAARIKRMAEAKANER